MPDGHPADDMVLFDQGKRVASFCSEQVLMPWYSTSLVLMKGGFIGVWIRICGKPKVVKSIVYRYPYVHISYAKIH